LFITALLAVIMSTIDSFTLLSSITFGRDLVWRIKRGDDQKIVSLTRLGLILTAVISIGLCMIFPSVIKLWYVIGSLFIPPMLLPVLTAYFPKYKLSVSYTFVIMISSFSLSLLSFIWGQFHQTDTGPAYLLGIEPFFPGFYLSIFLYGLFYLYGKINYTSLD
jgi:SSS family solute:Na+ symporter